MNKSGKGLLATASLMLVMSLGASEAALAMPLMQRSQVETASGVQEAGWRCGLGWHVNGWGRCVPNRPHRRHYWRRW